MAHKYQHAVGSFKRVVAKAPMTDAQKAVSPSTREQDAENLARIQRERPMKPPAKKARIDV